MATKEAGQKSSKTSIKVKGRKKKKTLKGVTVGIAHIKSTFNNTLISVTDMQGNVIAWSATGQLGFKGSRKGTPFAAQMAAEEAAKKAIQQGVKEVSVYVKGPGSGRETAIRALQSAGLVISIIKDVTPIPHNGCRAPNQRRV